MHGTGEHKVKLFVKHPVIAFCVIFVIPVTIMTTLMIYFSFQEPSDEPVKNVPNAEATAVSTTSTSTTTSTAIPATNVQMISQQLGGNGASSVWHFTIDGNDCIKYNADPI